MSRNFVTRLKLVKHKLVQEISNKTSVNTLLRQHGVQNHWYWKTLVYKLQ